MDLCGEVLIPVSYLINGATIATADVDQVSYYHIELDSHDILIANNLAVESYLDMDNHSFFEDEATGLDGLDRPANGKTYEDFCRPVATEGAVLSFARERLIARAESIGWKPGRDADLRLLVDGEIRRPLAEGDSTIFLFGDSARNVRLVSNTFVPARIGQGDGRELGICLLGLSFAAGNGGELRSVSLDDGRLVGLYDDEAKSGAHWRWTKGELSLDPQFWAGMTGQVAMFVSYSSMLTRHWIAPAQRVVAARPAEIQSSKRKRKLYSVR